MWMISLAFNLQIFVRWANGRMCVRAYTSSRFFYFLLNFLWLIWLVNSSSSGSSGKKWCKHRAADNVSLKNYKKKTNTSYENRTVGCNLMTPLPFPISPIHQHQHHPSKLYDCIENWQHGKSSTYARTFYAILMINKIKWSWEYQPASMWVKYDETRSNGPSDKRNRKLYTWNENIFN